MVEHVINAPAHLPRAVGLLGPDRPKDFDDVRRRHFVRRRSPMTG
jgi:hypothetical protein